jgi:mannosyl-oligosaccharide glucosidase
LLRALKEDAMADEPDVNWDNLNLTPVTHRSSLAAIYAKLRDNLVNNMAAVDAETGYVWEQYDPDNGKGKRTHPFTGWSALVVLLLADP